MCSFFPAIHYYRRKRKGTEGARKKKTLETERTTAHFLRLMDNGTQLETGKKKKNGVGKGNKNIANVIGGEAKIVAQKKKKLIQNSLSLLLVFHSEKKDSTR